MTLPATRNLLRAALLAVFLLNLLVGLPLGIAQADDIYVKKDTWAETMIASRAALLKVLAADADTGEIRMSPWHATESLRAKSFSEPLFPEKGVDLSAKDESGNPLWKVVDYRDGQVHTLPSHGGMGPTYLYRTITTGTATSLDCGFGSDDGLTVWLNKEVVVSQDVPRGPSANQNKATLNLIAGENALLFKVFNNSGGHGFYFGTGTEVDSPGEGLLNRIQADFPTQCEAMSRLGGAAWFNSDQTTDAERRMLAELVGRVSPFGGAIGVELQKLEEENAGPTDPRWLALFERGISLEALPQALKDLNPVALRLAIEDLTKTFGGKYPKGAEFLGRLDAIEKQILDVQEKGDTNRLAGLIQQYEQLKQEALLANPLLDFDRLMLIKRAEKGNLGLPQNWQGNCAVGQSGYDNEICTMSPRDVGGKLTTLFRPDGDGSAFVGDVDLHFDAERMLFSMPKDGHWQVWEMNIDGTGLRQVTQGKIAETHCYDPCYLPNENIIFASTACYQGVPCVGGGNTVANLFLTTPDGEDVRQLCFDQDHNWCPTVLNNGRVLFTRWEYSDTPHYFTRLLMEMNPDGSSQMEFYGSNSNWPNSFFYSRPIPNHPTKIVSIISGHHGVPRMGEMVIFDPAKGRHEASGAVQRIPGYGKKVEAITADGLVNNSWPKFLHPYPLSENYFLVSCKPRPDARWGIYLVDVFDNAVLLREEPGYALFEPVPLQPTKRPPDVPTRVRPGATTAMVYLTDIHFGRGMKGVPQGTVKELRLFEQHYAYPRMGGHINIGIDGPWDAKRILGTVPVEPDGSAAFIVPANTPIAVQPLDEKGRSMAVMRSWFVAQPGEVLSCIGCHEDRNSTPPAKMTAASRRPPSMIKPWYGPARGFGFVREVQPVLDKYCVGCHDGSKPGKPDFRVDGTASFRNFTPSYVALHPFVRRPGPESDYHLQYPMEWHASTSELIQKLEKGHHNVKLDDEAWDRLQTWIDLNVPDKGTWTEHRGVASEYDQRRAEMRKLYAGIDSTPEEILASEPVEIPFLKPQPEPERTAANLRVDDWPITAERAAQLQSETELEVTKQIELADGVTMDLVLVPAGKFVMGTHEAQVDEYPAAVVDIEKPFYMGRVEVTNAQFAAFDASHDSGVISMSNKDQSRRGYPCTEPNQPVVRVTWEQAGEFCQWLSEKTGAKVSLPTEAQWEWACRAGTDSDFSYGSIDTDFSKFANLADQTCERLALRDSPKWHPRDDRFNDGQMIATDVGRYQPNAWGLCDMHGNVAEWTASAYRPYPYDPKDGREADSAAGPKSVRGGGWYDRPHRARSGYRGSYQPWQRVYCVGFRVILEAE